MVIVGIISLVVGVIIGFLSSVIYHRKKVKGILRIDKSDPDGPYLFLELASDPRLLEKQKYVTLEVNVKNFVSHK